MKAYEFGHQNGLDGLRFAERAQPEAGPGELLVKVSKACLNHRDLLALKGQYGVRRPEERIPLSDGVGAIVAMGEGVSGFAEGQRVIAPHFCSWVDGDFAPTIFGNDLGISLDGWCAEYTVIPADAAIVVPDSVSDETAATLPSAGTTVWNCIVSFGGVKPGELVLAPGTGGVSILTLQVAKALGAEVAITSSSDEKLARCREMGADFTINYRTHADWPAALAEATGGRGADVIVDTVGMAEIENLIAAAAPNGRLALIGALGGMLDKTPNMFGIIGKNLVLKGITSGSRTMLAELLGLVADKNIEPLIDSKFAFDDVPAAYAHLASGDHMGKVMVEF